MHCIYFKTQNIFLDFSFFLDGLAISLKNGDGFVVFGDEVRSGIGVSTVGSVREKSFLFSLFPRFRLVICRGMKYTKRMDCFQQVNLKNLSVTDKDEIHIRPGIRRRFQNIR